MEGRWLIFRMKIWGWGVLNLRPKFRGYILVYVNVNLGGFWLDISGGVKIRPTILGDGVLVWWMTSKKPPKTTQLCEGVQTSPYSGFICRRAYFKDFARNHEVEFSLYTIPDFHPKNEDVCRGSQRKVRKWASSTRLCVRF